MKYPLTCTIFAMKPQFSVLIAKLMSVKATLLKRGATPDHSFSVARHDFPHFLKVWHYHVELELVYIVRSEGTRFIGDNIDRFQAGELMLIGSNLPHMYQNDVAYFEPKSEKRAEAYAVHFNPVFLKTSFSDIPELLEFHNLIEKAKLGLKFSAKTVALVGPKILALKKADDLSRMLGFMAILADLCRDNETNTIASSGFVNHFEQAGDLKLDKVYDYVMHHFQEDINVDDIVDLVSMNKSSFCRYFKRTTQKTFTEFLNDIRIGFACKMLVERQMGILEISYYCGYNNISHFNRQFKKKMSMSPSAYLISRRV